MPDVIIDQPPPVPNGKRPVWELVVEDMQERDRVGRQRYGTPLQPHNGRDALVDAYQEALDLAVYLRQRIEEEKTGAAPVAVKEALEGIALELLDRKAGHDDRARGAKATAHQDTVSHHALIRHEATSLGLGIAAGIIRERLKKLAGAA